MRMLMSITIWHYVSVTSNQSLKLKITTPRNKPARHRQPIEDHDDDDDEYKAHSLSTIHVKA